MNYSLGNMLGGAGALNADKLSLDLQFATDKTLTARKGPTPVFTRASTATFVGINGLIQSAAINAARFDHDPITLACKGLLIEESRTNSLQHSANFKNTTSSSYWENQTTTSVTVDQTTSPDGGNNADLLVTSTTSFDCYTRRAVGYTGSTQYTYSIFLKQGPSNHRYVGLYIGVGITALQFPFFDFNNPTVVQIPSGTMTGTINSTRVDAYPNGWYRVSVTFTTAATPVTNYAGVYISTSNGTLTSSSTAGLNAYIWGIQLELGAFPTSYIPTTTASVVRSADVCSITGSDFTGIYNATEGTLLVSADEFRRGTSFGSILRIADSANPSNNRYNVVSGGSKTGVSTPLEFSVVSGGSSQYSSTVNSATSNYKAAFAYKVNDMSGALNGTLTTADVPPSALIVTANTINIGGVGIHLASVRYFRKRLPNAKLKTLTT